MLPSEPVQRANNDYYYYYYSYYNYSSNNYNSIIIINNNNNIILLIFSCSEPLQLSGMSILAFRNPDNVHLLCDSGLRIHNTRHHFAKVYISFIGIGIVVFISFAMGLAAIYFVRRRTHLMMDFNFFRIPNIRYVRMKFNSRT